MADLALHVSDLAVHVRDHLTLSGCALALALLAGLPLGAVLARLGSAREVLLAAVNGARVVPSLAILALMLPLVGVGFAPALVALVLLAIPPIAINTDLGLRGVPAAAVDAARGLGMSPRQIAARVEWPLALPVVFAGVRTATVEVIASATLAAFIGGGGLGEYILNGFASGDVPQQLEGAISVAVLTLGADALLAALERRLSAHGSNAERGRQAA
jgi:osmoprotectant transport system permease protein